MTKYSDIPVCYGITKSKRIPLNISQLVNIRSIQTNLEALQLLRVHARDFKERIYIYEVTCINSQGKLYKGNLYKTHIRKPQKSPKLVTDSSLQKMAEEATRTVLDIFSLSGAAPIFSITLQFLCENNSEKHLWVLGASQLSFIARKIRNTGIRSKSHRRSEKVLMLIPRDPQIDPTRKITVESGKKDKRENETKLGFSTRCPTMIEKDKVSKMSRNKTYGNLWKGCTISKSPERDYNMMTLDKIETNPFLGSTQAKLKDTHGKKEIFYTINKRTVRTYKSIKERLLIQKIRACPGDFCKHNMKVNQPMNELLIFLGRTQLFLDSNKSKDKTGSVPLTPNREIIKIPQVTPSEHDSLKETRKNVDDKCPELVEVIKQKVDAIMDKGNAKDFKVEQILDVVKKHPRTKIVKVCTACKQIYERMAKYVIELLSP